MWTDVSISIFQFTGNYVLSLSLITQHTNVHIVSYPWLHVQEVDMVWHQLAQLLTPKLHCSVVVDSCKWVTFTRWWRSPRDLRGWPGPWGEVHTQTRFHHSCSQSNFLSETKCQTLKWMTVRDQFPQCDRNVITVKPSNTDTLGPKNVSWLARCMSLFQGNNSTYLYEMGVWSGVLIN